MFLSNEIKMTNAHVKFGDVCIPLIGISEDATQELCESCKNTFHLSEVLFNEIGLPLCKNCQNKTQPK